MSDTEKRFEKNDVRIRKTQALLAVSMEALLREYSFEQISVGDICKKAPVARATFYAYFADKYDFLTWWITEAWFIDIDFTRDTYEIMTEKVNLFVSNNKDLIRNLFADACNYTLDAVSEALHSVLSLAVPTAQSDPQHIVLSNFYVYGMIHYIMWQVKNGFPQSIGTMNEQLYKMIKTLRSWDEGNGGVPHEH